MPKLKKKLMIQFQENLERRTEGSTEQTLLHRTLPADPYCAEDLSPASSLLSDHPLFASFFPTPHFSEHFFDNIVPVECKINAKING